MAGSIDRGRVSGRYEKHFRIHLDRGKEVTADSPASGVVRGAQLGRCGATYGESSFGGRDKELQYSNAN